MRHSVKIAPPNSLLFISDPVGGVVPEWKRGAQILSSPSCISFGCMAFMDGETEVTLGAGREVDPGGIPAFDGVLETPNRAVVVSTVERKTILDASVPDRRTRVRIWGNRPTEPDQVIIGLG